MKRCAWLLALAAAVLPQAAAQTFPAPQYFRQQFTRPAAAAQLPGPAGVEDHIREGKLRLSVDDTIRLILHNQTDLRIQQLQHQQSVFAIERAYQPFDPLLISTFRPTRSTSPTTSALQGAETLSDLTHQAGLSYAQTFQTGTSYAVAFNSNRFATNSTFATFNPAFSSNLTFSLTQPLLRRRGLAVNRAPIVIAQRSARQSRSVFEGQINEAIAAAVNLYWELVQGRMELEVQRKSLEMAEVTYAQNKRALELGALPPLDIYRSEAQVAQRRLTLVQAEFRLKQREEDFRRLIGADLDRALAGLELVLTDRPGAGPRLSVVDLEAAIEEALRKRPEMAALQQAIANDETRISVAGNGMKPELNLTAFYTSSGRGGNLIDNSSGTPVLIAPGGFADSMSQLRSFDFPTYGATLELRLPIRNRAASADLGTALVSRRQNQYRERQLRQSILNEVRKAVHRVEESRQALEAAELLRDLSAKNLAAEERKYELGAQTIFFVLEAQTQLAQAELSLVQVQIGYQRVLTELARATGTLLERHRVHIAEALE
jgi:outer membrane protein